MPDGAGAYRLYGGIGSPYTMKVRAALRRMRLPHIFVLIDDAAAERIADVKPPIIPVLEHPDGAMAVDSTPMLKALSDRHPVAPHIYPDDPAQRFLALLIEDFADEWLTKAMFHFRWAYPEDASLLSRHLAFDRLRSVGDEKLQAAADWFKERQIARMPIVGCTPGTAAMIERSFERVCASIDDHVRGVAPFIFGAAPCVADFALFGQLFQLQRDPTPGARMRARTPWAQRWVEWVDDASGFEGEPETFDATGPLRGLLDEVANTYLPFLAANSEALEQGQVEVEIALRDGVWRQQSFKYQGKCLSALRQAYAQLPAHAQRVVREALDDDRAVSILS